MIGRRLAAAFAASLFLAACSRAPGGSASSGHNAWTIPGQLRIATRQVPDSLNPNLGTQTIDNDLAQLWGGRLFNWSDRDELVPELATRVPTQENGDISRDGLSVVYHLRPGVTWQDGAPFTADDVIFSWQQMINPNNNVLGRSPYDQVSRIDRKDGHTIVVHLKRAYAPFVADFFAPSIPPAVILPKHLLAAYPNINRVPFNSMPVGTGPFRVVSFEHGQRVVFEANPHYWRGAPKLHRITFDFIGSDNTILTLMQSHQLDVFFRAPETMAGSLSDIPGTRVVLAPFTRFADVGINAGVPALSDVRVRQALAYGLDRAALIAKVTHGVDMAGDTDQPPFFWAYDPNARKYPYDPARAAALLDAAGWRLGPDGKREKDGRPLQLTFVGLAGSATAAAAQVFAQEQWSKLGIDVTIKEFPSNELYATLPNGGIEQSGKFDVVFENWSNATDPDESILVGCDKAPPAGWNIYHFCNARVDAAERAALSNYARPVRLAAYRTVQETMQDQLPFIVLWYQREFDVVNTDFKGYAPARAGTPFWNTYAWSI